MRILGLVGSRRHTGNTARLVGSVLEPGAAAGAETEVHFLGDYAIDACTGCEGCADSWECIIKDDYARIRALVDDADGLVLASPTYWYSVTSDMKRFIDRSYSLIQYPHDRHHWVGKYHGAAKRCVTVAVCEQTEEEMMGNTSALLRAFASDIGLEVVASVKALGFFEAGSVAGAPQVLEEARAAGRQLLGAANT